MLALALQIDVDEYIRLGRVKTMDEIEKEATDYILRKK